MKFKTIWNLLDPDILHISQQREIDDTKDQKLFQTSHMSEFQLTHVISNCNHQKLKQKITVVDLFCVAGGLSERFKYMEA